MPVKEIISSAGQEKTEEEKSKARAQNLPLLGLFRELAVGQLQPNSYAWIAR